MNINRNHAEATITIPNGVKGGFRTKLACMGFDGFLQLVREIELQLRSVIKNSAGSKPVVYAIQRHFSSQRSVGVVDGRITADLRTAVKDETSSVKYQPQWIEAIYQLVIQKRSNIQLGFEVQFEYSCERLRSARAVDLFASAWIAMSPILEFVLDE